ncbi:diguanylate cyclase [Shewanella sp. YLB-07]|uniref:transporter substrate-binding domain-containing diguanylate cyclase n=1 Tax=Shewanella sp. YLB-07 TaxID=2601268 RepID=UPI00128DE178|nr:sensor domain-containing diguanylate cyclase [Shewanella sp. YLB-07]MPY23883.1 sensor domain-containing diguanylate cyclase [Shewanella sp. YLB-07]
MDLNLPLCRRLRHICLVKKSLFFFAIFYYLLATCSSASENDQDIKNTKHKKQLIIANSKAWKPFSYIDTNGEAQGLLIDIWKEYARVNDVDVSFLLTDWNDSLQAVKAKEADVHAGLLWSEHRETYLDFLPGIVKIDTQLFFSSKLLGTDVRNYLESGRVGVVFAGYEETYMMKHYPKVKLIAFDNNELMLKSAFSGEIHAFVADFQVANFYLYTSQRPNQFSPVKHLYSGLIRPAVAEGQNRLRLELQHGFKQISAVDLERIQRKWIHVETVYPKYLLPMFFALILLLTAAYIFHLRRAVAHRTHELHQLNRELQRLASIDAMTNIYNRRYFIELLQQACDDNQTGLSLLLFDIDRFKSINDNFGHSVGDFIICAMVKTIKRQLPPEAVFGRIGGEEFCIFIQGLTPEQSQELAKRVQSSVTSSHYCQNNIRHAVSISLGAVYCEEANIDHQFLINQADHLMYIAKSMGRDCYQFNKL